jgi:hypothetical protein
MLITPTRRMGWVLSIYGLIGVIAMIAVLVGSIALGYQIGRLKDQVATQRQALVSTLDSTILLLGTVTNAAGNIDTTLSAASTTIGKAADLAKSAGDAAQTVADAGNFSIFGQQPLAGITKPFGDIATQAKDISAQITQVTTSLDGLSGDLTAAVPALEQIQAQAQTAKDNLVAADRLDDLPTYIGFGIIGIGIYLAWLGMTSLGALWLGRRVLRAAKAGGPEGGQLAPAAVVAAPVATTAATAEAPTPVAAPVVAAVAPAIPAVAPAEPVPPAPTWPAADVAPAPTAPSPADQPPPPPSVS